MRNLQVISTLLALFLAFYSEAQIRFIEYENVNAVSGYELVEFTYHDDQGVELVDTFDVVLHNPFNNLDFLEKVDLRNGQPFNINQESLFQLQNEFGCMELDGKKSSRNQMRGYAQTNVVEENDYVLISYNLFIEEDNVGKVGRGGRFASILMLNHKGEIVNRLSRLPMDVYSPSISENGRYLAFGHGQGLYASDGPNVERGYQIWDLSQDALFHEETDGRAYSVGCFQGMITLGYYDNHVHMVKMLDILNANIYGPVAFSQFLGHLMVRQPDGRIVQCKDLPMIK